MNGFKQLVTLVSLLILLMALSAGSAQDHPFSEIFPDGPLEFEGEDIEDVGVIQVDGGLIIEENIIEDTSGVYRINLDSDEEVLRLEADDDISLDLDMEGDSIQNIDELEDFFDSACDGEVLADVQNDGSFICVDPTEEVSEDFVDREGDTMTGTLDMRGNNIIDIGDLTGTGIVNSDQISSSAVGSSEIEVDSVTLDELDESDVDGRYVTVDGDAMEGTLDMRSNSIIDIGNLEGSNIVNTAQIAAEAVGLNELEEDTITINTGNHLVDGGSVTLGDSITLNVDPSGIDWTDTSMDETDVDLSDVGAADTDLNMNNYDIENINELAEFFDSACPAGEAVVDVDDDGSILCTDVSDDVSDDYVSRDGDSMTGTLDMTGNDIIDIGNLEGSSIVNTAQIASSAVESSEIADNSVNLDELDESDVDGRYVNRDGDTMSGDLDLGSDYLYAREIRGGSGSSMYFEDSNGDRVLRMVGGDGRFYNDLSVGDASSSPSATLDVDGDTLFRDDINLDGNSISNFFGSDCPSGEALIDVNNDGSFDCMDVSDDVADDYVNRDGDTMTGDLTIDHSSNPSLTIEEPSSSTNPASVRYSTEDGEWQTGTTSGGQYHIAPEHTGSRSGFRDGSLLTVDSNGDVEVPQGDLDVSGDITGSDWGDLDIDQSDVQVSDLGASDDDLDMDGNDITRAGLTHTDELLVSDSPDDGPLPATDNSAYIEGDLSIDGDFIGAGADLAEIMTVSDNQEDELEPGEVVVLDENLTVKRSEEAKDTGAAGVVSTDPAMVMAKDRDGVELALSGTAPVKVTVENGEIQPGDLLTTSDEPGKAMRCEKPVECHGSVIGKAGESISSDGEIEMVITLS